MCMCALAMQLYVPFYLEVNLSVEVEIENQYQSAVLRNEYFRPLVLAKAITTSPHTYLVSFDRGEQITSLEYFEVLQKLLRRQI